jgi:RHS repeat-associated protein
MDLAAQLAKWLSFVRRADARPRGRRTGRLLLRRLIIAVAVLLVFAGLAMGAGRRPMRGPGAGSIVKSNGHAIKQARARAQSSFVPFSRGDVFVGGSAGGTISHYSSSGVLVDTLSTGATYQVTGMCFDAFGDMFATNFSDTTVTELDDTGRVIRNPYLQLLGARPESCVVDTHGNVYVSEVDSAFSNALVKVDPAGNTTQYLPAKDRRGIDWIDLQPDQCTFLYTSEGSTIKRFNVCTNTQLPDFATGLPLPCYALRIRPNGEVMVACTSQILRLSASGALVQSYPASNYGESNQFALALDPDGTSVWTGDLSSNDVLKIDIATGGQLLKFNNPSGVNGVAVSGSVIPVQSPPPAATYGSPCQNPRYADVVLVQQACAAVVNDPVNLATGAVSSTATDAKMPSIGEAFAFERSYTSLDTATSELGIGWTDSYAASLAIDTDSITWRSGSGAQTVFAKQGDGSYKAPAWSTTTLTANGSGYEVVTPSQVHFLFDAQGRLTGVKDRNGQGVTIAYDAQGNRSTITDSAGRAVAFEYTQGLLTRLVLPDGRDVRYGYTDGRLTTVTDLRGNVYTYAYDAQGRLWTETDQNNHLVVKNTYGADGRISTQEDANQHVTHYDWDQPTETATVTDARNHAWTYRFDGTLMLEKTDALGNSVHYSYDPDTGDLVGFRDALGHVESMTYDSRHNLLSRTAPAPLSYQEVWTYNSFNDKLTYKDRRGNQTDYGYDSAGNLKTVTGPDPDGTGPLGRPVTTYGLDPAGTGLVLSVTDPRLKTTQHTYDPTTHQLASTTTPLGEKTTFTYDATGRLKTSVEPRGNVTGGTPADYTTTFAYDNADHLTKITSPDPDGTGPQLPLITQWLYDPAGNLQTFTDANTHAVDYGYDAADQLTSVTAPDPDGAGPLPRPVTQYGYDEVANLKTRTVAGTHTTTYGYDDANRLASVSSPTGQLWTYGYDANSNRTTQIDANGNASPASGDGTTTYGYDALGRLSSVSYSDSTPPVTYAYDGNDNLTQTTDGAGTETYTYDTLDNLTKVTRGTDSFSYVYDIGSNRTQTTYPDNTAVTATYDNDERLATVASGGLTTSYGYDPAGELTTTTLPSANGFVETRAYDRAGRLTSVTNKKGTTTLSSFAYTLDPVGNPTKTVRTGATSETDVYTYDGLDRLTSVCFQASCPGGSDPFVRWTYDAVGNRLTEARPTGTTSYTYNNADQLTQAGSTAYTYDQNGNEKTAGATTFAYDLANRLVSTTSGTTTTTYTYDGLGKRLQASTGSQSTKKTNYLWDISSGLPQIALERNGNNALIRRYVYGARRLTMSTGSSPYYYLYDWLGSAVNLTSSTGATEWTDSYEPFGRIHSETKNDTKAPANPMQFDGEYLDATGLYHLRARQYDPSIGRFTTLDPASRNLKMPYSASYVYAEDQPTKLIDPTGLHANTCGSILCFLKDPRNYFDAVATAGAAAFCAEGAEVGFGLAGPYGAVGGCIVNGLTEHIIVDRAKRQIENAGE